MKLCRDELPVFAAGAALGVGLIVWAALDQERLWVRLGIGLAVAVVILAAATVTPRRWFTRRRNRHRSNL